MSIDTIAKALELKLSELTPALPTGFANADFKPPSGQPYQLAFVMTARPENPTMGVDHYRQRGYFQIALKYPSNAGAGLASRRADLLRSHFRRGLSLTTDGVTTIIDATPEIGSGSNEGDRYIINVFVRFYADIFGA